MSTKRARLAESHCHDPLNLGSLYFSVCEFEEILKGGAGVRIFFGVILAPDTAAVVVNQCSCFTLGVV